MAATETVSFWKMYRDLPVRTTVGTVVPVFLAVVQLLNGYVNGIPLHRVAGFAVVMLVAAVLVTQYHLVQYRRIDLQRDAFADE